MAFKKIIKKLLHKHLTEGYTSNIELNLNREYVGQLIKALSKYTTDEELLRGGGLPIELLDRLAHGFSENDIKTLNPNDLKVRWVDDLNNVKWEIEKSDLTPKKWATGIKLVEPIDVSYWGDEEHPEGFYIEDGHHRYMAAKILNKPLNVNLEIKINPITKITPTMGYDEFHRYVFNKYKNDAVNEGVNGGVNEGVNSIKVYHGTKPKFVESIKKDGLKDRSGYNQGWYMVSTDFESALFHAHPEDNGDAVYVFEFNIPNEDNDRWYGYPYLWKGQKMNDNSMWFALMQEIPTKYITKIHKVTYKDWVNQKNRGFS